jgi:hypothetical protein
MAKYCANGYPTEYGTNNTGHSSPRYRGHSDAVSQPLLNPGTQQHQYQYRQRLLKQVKLANALIIE